MWPPMQCSSVWLQDDALLLHCWTLELSQRWYCVPLNDAEVTKLNIKQIHEKSTCSSPSGRISNGIWSDMVIESTSMKIGKGLSGIIDITTNDRSVSIWTNSHHLCTALLTELTSLVGQLETSNDKHKEESNGRIDADDIDRTKLHSTLHKCIHPLDIDSHACDKLMNICPDDTVNVNKAFEI